MLYDDLPQQISAQELSTLLNVSSALASTLELPEVLQLAIESTTEVVGVNTGAIYTLENDSLYLGATTPPLPDKFPEELRIAQLDDHPHIKKTIITKKTHISCGREKCFPFACRKNCCCLP